MKGKAAKVCDTEKCTLAGKCMTEEQSSDSEADSSLFCWRCLKWQSQCGINDNSHKSLCSSLVHPHAVQWPKDCGLSWQGQSNWMPWEDFDQKHVLRNSWKMCASTTTTSWSTHTSRSTTTSSNNCTTTNSSKLIFCTKTDLFIQHLLEIVRREAQASRGKEACRQRSIGVCRQEWRRGSACRITKKKQCVVEIEDCWRRTITVSRASLWRGLKNRSAVGSRRWGWRVSPQWGSFQRRCGVSHQRRRSRVSTVKNQVAPCVRLKWKKNRTVCVAEDPCVRSSEWMKWTWVLQSRLSTGREGECVHCIGACVDWCVSPSLNQQNKS